MRQVSRDTTHCRPAPSTAGLTAVGDDPEKIDPGVYAGLSRKLGALDANIASVEAQACSDVRITMTAEQTTRTMALRGEYIIDASQAELLGPRERWAALFTLCAGCHGGLGRHVPQNVGPALVGILGRKIATARDYDYSQGLRSLAEAKTTWTPELLDEFLQAPRRLAPGTKMEFQVLSLEADRSALIGYLESLER